MKKDNSISCLGALAIAMVLVDFYLIKSAASIAVLAVAGVVTLVATYLFLDKIYGLLLSGQGDKEEKAFFKVYCEEAQKADKAKYLTLKKTQELFEAKLSQIENSQTALLEAVEKLCEEENKNAKLIVKYNREDSKKVAAISKADTEKMIAVLKSMKHDMEKLSAQKTVGATEIDKILESMNQNFAQLGEQLGNISVTVPVNVATEPVTEPEAIEVPEEVIVAESEPELVEEQVVAAEEIVEVEPAEVVEEAVTEEPEEELAVVEETAEEELAEVEETAEEELAEVEETPAPEMDLSDPNKMMGPDDIAALLASMGVDEPAEEIAEVEPVLEEAVVEELAATMEEEPESAPEIDLSDPNKMMGPDDIAALFASIGGDAAPEPEPEPAPAAETGDPNKQLSPEEIAALFSSLG